MAIVYKVEIKTRKLVEFFRVNDFIRIPDIASVWKYNTINKEIFEELSEGMTTDLFYSDEDNNFRMHHHSGFEKRLIVSGKATFYVYDGNRFLYIIDAEPLDLIELEPEVIHWFSNSGELVVYRFFSDNERIAWDNKPVPDELRELEDFIYNHGRRLE